MSFLKINNLSVDYKMRKETVYAAKNVNIDVNKGEILGLVGESGSGKSTVGNAIINLIMSNEENNLYLYDLQDERSLLKGNIEKIVINSCSKLTIEHLITLSRKIDDERNREIKKARILSLLPFVVDPRLN